MLAVDADEKELQHAAVRVQAMYRGYSYRKKSSADPQPSRMTKKSKQVVESRDGSLEKAAVKVQSLYRGYSIRKLKKPSEEADDTSARQETKKKSSRHRSSKSLSEQQAAVKMQSLFRGYRDRKIVREVKEEIGDPQESQVTVMLRVRPLLDDESMHTKAVFMRPQNGVQLLVGDSVHDFYVDSVFPDTSDQNAIFEAIRPKVLQVLAGHNVAFAIYGPKRSGKTHTFMGSVTDSFMATLSPDRLERLLHGEKEVGVRKNWGIMPRAVQEIFDALRERKKSSEEAGKREVFAARVSYLEILNERVIDLLRNGLSEGRPDFQYDSLRGRVKVQAVLIISRFSSPGLPAFQLKV